MYYEELTIKVDAEGLYLYEKGVAIKPPKVILNRIASSEGITEFIMPLLRQLEYLGVIICNSSNATMLATHKFLHLQELASNKIPIASTFSYSASDLSEVNTTLVDNELGYPQIMKSVHGSQGSKVVLLPSPDLVSEMKNVLNHEVPFLFQDYIKESHGRDIRVIVVDNKVSFSMIRSSNTSSVKANLSAGGTAEVVTGKYPDAEELALKLNNPTLKAAISGNIGNVYANKKDYKQALQYFYKSFKIYKTRLASW
jgi:RimK family alpha-L-glutamate ligase